jgi:hypothetical protein
VVEERPFLLLAKSLKPQATSAWIVRRSCESPGATQAFVDPSSYC